jgi:hypothetical protein
LVQKANDNTAFQDHRDSEAALSCRRLEEDQAGRDHFGTQANIINRTVTYGANCRPPRPKGSLEARQ